MPRIRRWPIASKDNTIFTPFRIFGLTTTRRHHHRTHSPPAAHLCAPEPNLSYNRTPTRYRNRPRVARRAAKIGARTRDTGPRHASLPPPPPPPPLPLTSTPCSASSAAPEQRTKSNSGRHHDPPSRLRSPHTRKCRALGVAYRCPTDAPNVSPRPLLAHAFYLTHAPPLTSAALGKNLPRSLGHKDGTLCTSTPNNGQRRLR